MQTESAVSPTGENSRLQQKLGFGEKFSYSLAGAGEMVSFAATSVFMVFFYTDFMGINAGIAGTIMLVSKILDAVVTILLGFLFDKSEAKKGTARSWLLWFAIPHSLMLILTFYVPHLGMTGRIIYAFVTYNLLMTVAWSAINLAYNVLNARMTTDQLDRADLSVFRVISAAVATIAVNVFTLNFVKKLGNTSIAWTLAMVVYAVVALLLFVLTYIFVKERVGSSNTEQIGNTLKDTIPEQKQSGSIAKQILAALKNKYCVMLMALFALSFAIQGLQNVFIYYCIYFLKDANILGIRTIAGAVVLILLLLVMHPLIKKFGKRNLSLTGAIVELIGTVMLVVNPGNIPLSIISYMIFSLGFAPFNGIKIAMVADSVEYGEWKNGIRNEGMTFSMVQFGQKIGTGIGSALTGWLLSVANYVPNAKAESAGTMNAILWLMIWIPAILCILQVIVLWIYKLDKEYPYIMHELKPKSETSAGTLAYKD